jgi:hypothetical protein
MPHPASMQSLPGAARCLALVLPCVLAFAGLPASAQHDYGSHGGHGAAAKGAGRAAAAICPPATLACASAATPAFAADGALLVAFTGGGVVSVARSTDLGRTFGKPVPLAPPAPRMDTGADAKPQIAVDRAGRVAVAWGVFKDARFNAEVMIATSDDGGLTFSPARTLGENPASQRFPALAATADGGLFLAWLDKRNVAASRGTPEPIPASLAWGWSNDGGKTFTSARIARDGTCECCRIALALLPGDRPAAVFRNVFPGSVRDHGFVAFTRDGAGPVQRVSDDQWVTGTCPHHGPSLAVTADGAVHAAWFTQGRRRDGVFLAASRDEGRTFSAPAPIGDPAHAPARPSLLAIGSTLLVAWKEFDGKQTMVRLMRSRDAGASWTTPATVATAGGYSDHPLLVAHRDAPYLSWLAHPAGYRLVALEASR